MLISLYIYLLLFFNSQKTKAKMEEPKYIKRFQNMELAALFMVALMILFAIDSLYTSGYTIYSWIGWVCYIFGEYFLYTSLLKSDI
jgi:hypothetical protein